MADPSLFHKVGATYCAHNCTWYSELYRVPLTNQTLLCPVQAHSPLAHGPPADAAAAASPAAIAPEGHKELGLITSLLARQLHHRPAAEQEYSTRSAPAAGLSALTAMESDDLSQGESAAEAQEQLLAGAAMSPVQAAAAAAAPTQKGQRVRRRNSDAMHKLQVRE